MPNDGLQTAAAHDTNRSARKKTVRSVRWLKYNGLRMKARASARLDLNFRPLTSLESALPNRKQPTGWPLHFRAAGGLNQFHTVRYTVRKVTANRLRLTQ